MSLDADEPGCPMRSTRMTGKFNRDTRMIVDFEHGDQAFPERVDLLHVIFLLDPDLDPVPSGPSGHDRPAHKILILLWPPARLDLLAHKGDCLVG